MKLRLALASSALFALGCSHAQAACGSGDSGTPEQIVQAQVDAYNAHDVGALAACYADDARLVYLSGEHPPIEGKDAIRTAFGFLATQPKAFRVEIVRRTVNGPVIVDLERVHGLPPGKHLPDALAVYEVRAGRIARVWFPPAK